MTEFDKALVNEKMEVLSQLCLVTVDNRRRIKNRLKDGIKLHPNQNPQVVLDQIARSIIFGN